MIIAEMRYAWLFGLCSIPVMNWCSKIFAISFIWAQNTFAQGGRDFWDLEPIRYSDTIATDRLAVLAKKIEERKLAGQPGHGLKALEFVLDELNVPKESQVLVFPKRVCRSGASLRKIRGVCIFLKMRMWATRRAEQWK